jgi:hypothetical protein
MKKILQMVGALLMLAIVPVSILWVWNPDHWWQFLISDIILFAGGMITIATSISPLPSKTKDPKDPIIWHS